MEKQKWTVRRRRNRIKIHTPKLNAAITQTHTLIQPPTYTMAILNIANAYGFCANEREINKNNSGNRRRVMLALPSSAAQRHTHTHMLRTAHNDDQPFRSGPSSPFCQIQIRRSNTAWPKLYAAEVHCAAYHIDGVYHCHDSDMFFKRCVYTVSMSALCAVPCAYVCICMCSVYGVGDSAGAW